MELMWLVTVKDLFYPKHDLCNGCGMDSPMEVGNSQQLSDVKWVKIGINRTTLQQITNVRLRQVSNILRMTKDIFF